MEKENLTINMAKSEIAKRKEVIRTATAKVEDVQKSLNSGDATKSEMEIHKNVLVEKQEQITKAQEEIGELELYVEELDTEMKKGIIGTLTPSSLQNNGGNKNMDNIQKYLASDEYAHEWVKNLVAGTSDAEIKKGITQVTGVDAGQFGDAIPTVISEAWEKQLEQYGNLIGHAKKETVTGISKDIVTNGLRGAKFVNEGEKFDLDKKIKNVIFDAKRITASNKFSDEIQNKTVKDMVQYLQEEFMIDLIYGIEAEMVNGKLDADGRGMNGIMTIAADADDARAQLIDAEGKLDTDGWKIANIANAQIRGNQRKAFMSESTYYILMNQTDLNNRPLFTETVVGTMTFGGVPVEFTDALLPIDVAGKDDCVVIVGAKDAYKIKSPNGMTPKFTIDAVSLADTGETKVTASAMVAGNIVLDKSFVAIKKGEVVAPATRSGKKA